MPKFLTSHTLHACLCALLLLHALPRVPAQEERQSIALPNGSSITLLGWSYGTYHELVPGREDRHTNIAPPDTPDPKEIGSCETEENALVFWIKRTGRDAQAGNITMYLDWLRRQVRVADENGNEIAPTAAHWRMNRSTSPQALKDDPIAIASFPRRGKSILLRIYSPEPKKLLGEFRIPNPIRNVAQPLIADRLPAIKRSGDLALTLSPLGMGRVKHYIYKDGSSEILGDLPRTPEGYRVELDPLARTVMRASFSFRNRPSNHWGLSVAPDGMWDASGNRLISDFTNTGNGKLWYVAPNIGEPVRVRVAAFQLNDEQFVPDRTWTVQNCRVPAPGAVVAATSSIKMEGAELRLLGIAGAGVRRVEPASFTAAPSGFVAVLLHLTYPGPAPSVLLRITDSRGHPIVPLETPFGESIFGESRLHSSWFGYGGSSGTTAGDYVYYVKVPPGSGNLNLTFGLSRQRYFEFVLPDTKP